MLHRLPAKIKQNKPIYTGFSILEISKALMYRFHYDVMLATYGLDCRLLFTDTDSFCYHIKTDDVYVVIPKTSHGTRGCVNCDVKCTWV